jgi:PKD repeat protein
MIKRWAGVVSLIACIPALSMQAQEASRAGGSAAGFAPACNADVKDVAQPGSVVRFNAALRDSYASAHGAASVFDWDFGDQTPHAKTANPSHTYRLPGIYMGTVSIHQGSSRCTTTWVIAVPKSAPYALANSASSAAHETLTGIERDYRAESLGTNLKGTPQYPVLADLTGAPIGDISCQAKTADFILGDENTIDRDGPPRTPADLSSIPASRLGMRLRTGRFACTGSGQVSGAQSPAAGASKPHFVQATVQDTGEVQVLAGSRFFADGSEYLFDGSSWQSFGAGWDAILEAFRRRGDPDWLSGLVQKHSQALVRKAALAVLTSEPHLAAIAFNSAQAADRLYAVQRLTSPALLAEVVSKSTDSPTQLAALQRISDQPTLAGIAQSGLNEKIRLVALGAVSNRAALVDIYRKSPPGSAIHLAALGRLDGAAVGMIADKSLLNEIALNASRTDIRLAAINKVDDRQTLQDAALKDPAQTVRLAAIAKVGDEETLGRAATADSAQAVRLAAVRRLRDPETLSHLAQTHPDAATARAAMERISDSAALADIALKAESSVIRKAAVARITDQRTLADVAIRATDVDLGTAALRGVKDPSLLESVARKASKAAIWRSAAESSGQVPIAASRLHDLTMKVLCMPFQNNGVSQSNDSVGRVATALVETLGQTGWQVAKPETPVGVPGASIDSSLESARREGAPVILTGTATSVAGKPAKHPSQSLTFEVSFLDVTTGKTILADSFTEPLRRNSIPPKQVRKAVNDFVKRLNDDLRKGKAGSGGKSAPSRKKKGAGRESSRRARDSAAAV